ncbi:MAG: tyrosine-type recombinase/integrase [Streptosporangiaceae bacterium]
MTAAVSAGAAARPRQLSAEALAVMEKFPPRPVPLTWDATAADRFAVVRRMLAPPFLADGAQARQRRKLTLLKTLDWLELHPGTTWQERWNAAGAGTSGRTDWRDRMLADLRAAGLISPEGERNRSILGMGLLQLTGGDVLRPALPWLLSTRSPSRFAAEMAHTRDPGGIAALKALREAGTAGDATFTPAVERVALIMAAKGGLVTDITPGDCVELLNCCSRLFPGGSQQAWRHSPFFYQLLHAAGLFPDSAPATVRMISSSFPGQLTAEQLVDRYDLACRAVRDLLADYLRERQPGIDYSTLNGLATTLALRFWKDLETHHPGIGSLRLPPDIAAGWKQRIQAKTARTPGGGEQFVAREAAEHILVTVRAFYLDLGQWALDDPARWGPWAVPCPIRGSDIQYKNQKSRTKARMDQRTRERLPVLPALTAAADRERKDAAARLDAARAVPPGEPFTAGGQALHRARLTRPSRRIWAEDPGSGKRRDLILEEDSAFWAWAAIEVLRMTGLRIEELTELSHHSLVQYRLPSSGELVPLLSVAPSKTDQERLLVIDPELADVLSAVITRVRGADGAVPLAAAYDTRERTWNPPMPLLFQRVIGLENRPIPGDAIRDLLRGALVESGITGIDRKPIHFQPHDFRRLFTTSAILNGMPPHIAQLILGHNDINTTMGYKAAYPEEVIRSHRAFITRRRELRPSEEYRSPSDSEWEEFLGHFERRRVALGDCGRAYSASCIHEHACVRCPLLRIDPAQRGRLADIRDNLLARIAEAEREGWAGEAEGLKVSLAAANNKLAAADTAAARRSAAVNLGIPAYRDIAAATLSAGDHHDR